MKLKSHPALIALTSVIVIGSLALLLVIFIIFAGLDLLELGLNDTKYSQTFAGSDGCVEEALLKVISSSSYSGESLTVGDVDCEISVSGSGRIETVTVSANHESGYAADIETTIDYNTSPASLDDWDKTLN